ncbi:arsenate-mycothiol transferase ArsC [Cyclobacterium marinum]|uniref:Protein tyrosine phosphatase n=1 Tax=Cyclobacterium marinum (strain ATCC 25205 / DSM 745 / LMG 13164 / NCIMB 1802) TaxID=880070 RepID=G0J118_CYCMS|nr:protein-tyrosine-phosphatase [Cyclobacterium marinum]AEL25767.1 protein tyrosine phosphatase [Cyclobacterium marinum DSM 745]
MLTSQPQLFPEIITTIRNLKPKNITAERKLILKPLIDFIQAKVESQQEIRLNFICTHNSRRSHLSQVWAQVMAYNFKINNLYCYSGGTEATALFPKVAETLQKSGLLIQNLSEQENPVYGIKYASNQHPIIGFSKKYDDAFNPTSNFAAIMTCSQADAGCPFIPGAEKRIPITFDDPKAFDNRPEQDEKYMERSLQIATEMYHVFSEIKL